MDAAQSSYCIYLQKESIMDVIIANLELGMRENDVALVIEFREIRKENV